MIDRRVSLTIRAMAAPGSIAALCMFLSVGVRSAALADTAPNGPHTLSSPESAVVMQFDTLSGRRINATNDANRVDSLTFPYNNDYVNLAVTESSGGPNHCNDPEEYFGQAVGYPDATKAPLMVASGERASWTEVVAKNKSIAQAKTFTGLATCPGTSLSGLTRTIYTLNEYRGYGVKVERTLRFKAGLGVLPNSGLRAYLPRVDPTYHYVLVPNAAGNVVRYDANNCTTSPCTVTDWNGKWVSDDFGNGFGLIILRDPSSTTPAFIGIQSGGASNANFTSIVLSQPAGGWSGIVTETEYLCYYFPNEWTPAANTLPPLCANATPIGH